jgi:hypothetical protein
MRVFDIVSDIWTKACNISPHKGLDMKAYSH